MNLTGKTRHFPGTRELITGSKKGNTSSGMKGVLDGELEVEELRMSR